MTFIGVEGVDGAGKSSLVDAIVLELNKRFPGEEVAVHHFSQLKNDPFDEYALKFEAYRPGDGRHVVCDRLHWGELVYGPLYRGGAALDEAGFRWVELYLRARGATVWHVTADLSDIRSRLNTRGEDYLESHHVARVWGEFRVISERSSLTGGTADTSQHMPEALAKHVVTEAVYQEEQARYNFTPEYVGRSVPSVVLVGDKQGNLMPGVTRAPFMSRGGSSGRYLLDALPDKFWEQVGLVNVNETKIEETLERHFNPVVVALGANASRALDEAGIAHGAVPHPQWVRRFRNDMKMQYGLLIRDVAMHGGNQLSWQK